MKPTDFVQETNICCCSEQQPGPGPTWQETVAAQRIREQAQTADDFFLNKGTGCSLTGHDTAPQVDPKQALITDYFPVKGRATGHDTAPRVVPEHVQRADDSNKADDATVSMRGGGLGQGEDEDDARSVSPTYMESPISTSPAHSFESPRTTSPVHSSRCGSIHTIVEGLQNFDGRSYRTKSLGSSNSQASFFSILRSGGRPPKTYYAIPKYILKKLKDAYSSPKKVADVRIFNGAEPSGDVDFDEEVDLESVIQVVPETILEFIHDTFLHRAKSPDFPKHLRVKIEYEDPRRGNRYIGGVGSVLSYDNNSTSSHIEITSKSQEGPKLWKDCPKDLTTVIPQKVRSELQTFYLRRLKKGEPLNIGITVKFEEQDPTPAEPYYSVIPQHVLNQVYNYFKDPTRRGKEVVDAEIWTEEVKKEKQEQAIAEAREVLNKGCLGFDNAIESLRGGEKSNIE